ncbi:MAG: 50S ribosomal protein L35 [Clostridia bacterium]
MPKMKTRSSVKKRFKVSKTGNVKSSKMGRRHILTKKNTKRKRNLRKGAYLRGQVAANIKRQLPY